MTLAIGNDHAGTECKFAILTHLKSKGYAVVNYGSDDDNRVDYADFVHPVAVDVEIGKANMGILICGSANGVAMTANKHQKIRAALCWNTKIAELARAHNDANILCIPARFTTTNQVLDMVDIFLKTPFEGGRHQQRIDKIPLPC